MPPVPAPLNALGQPGQVVVPGWGPESFEDTPELRYPQSVITFDRMRRVGKVATVRRAWQLPLRRAFRRARLDGDGIDEAITRHVEVEMGLPPTGEGVARRRREGIDFDQAVREALTYLDFGHSVLEQEAQPGPPAPGLTGLPPVVAHLSKLAWRHPRSIARFATAPDGMLDGIVQYVVRGNPPRSEEQPIPITQLVVFVNDREGADWSGTSLLRAAWPHYLISDGLMRLGPMVAERNGMGVPTVEYEEGGSEAKALAIAEQFRAGDKAGIAHEAGYHVRLLGVEGTLKDELPLLKWHQEELAKTCLAMFLDLGHDNGARSLGETFADTFYLALDAVADYVASVFTEHVIRDLVEWTWGPGAPYPRLVPASLVEEPQLAADQLATLADKGLVTPDEPTEAWLRKRHNMPDRAEVEGDVKVSGRPFTQADLEAGTVTVDEHRAALGLGTHHDPEVGRMSVVEYKARLAAGAAAAGAGDRQLAAMSDEQLAARVQQLLGRLTPTG